MCTWECGPVWEHARRWRVGNPAGSAGGRLRLRGCAILYQLVYQPVCAPGPDFIQYTVLAFCEFSFGPVTLTFPVAGRWIVSLVSTHFFGVVHIT